MAMFSRKPDIADLVAKRKVNRVIAALRHPDSSIREEAARGLGALADPAAVPALVAELCESSDVLVRMYAARSLAMIGGDTAVDALADALASRRNVEGVVEALAAIGGGRADDLLAASLDSLGGPTANIAGRALEAHGWATDDGRRAQLAVVNQDWDLAIALGAAALDPLRRALERGVAEAAGALGAIGDPGAVPTLASALDSDGPAYLRTSAVEALGHIGDGAAIARLTQALEDSDVQVRGGAAGALQRLGWGEGEEQRASLAVTAGEWETAIGFGSVALAAVVAALDDSRGEHRAAAARALGTLGGAAAIDPLIRALGDPAEAVVCAAAESLGALGAKQAAVALADALSNNLHQGASSLEVVKAAIGAALRQIGEPAAVDALEPLLADGPLVGFAAEVLGDVGGSRAARVLADALAREGHAPVGRALERCLEASADVVEADLLYELSDLADPIVISIRKEACGNQWNQEVLVHSTRLRQLARQAIAKRGLPEPSERRAAENPLDASGEPSSFDLLVERLRDEDPQLRRAAADAMGLATDERSADALFDLLRDDDLGVRRSAIDALGRTGDPRAVEALDRSLRDEDTGVEAARALLAIGDKPAIEVLKKAARSKSPKIGRRLPALAALVERGGPDAIAVVNEVVASLRRVVERSVTTDGGPWDGGRKSISKGAAGEAEPAVAALELCLDRWSELVDLDLLRSLRNLSDLQPVVVTVQHGCTIPVTDSAGSLIDGARLRQLARQELVRRGEDA